MEGSDFQSPCSNGMQTLSCTFASMRVSTPGQTTDNQRREIAQAGFDIPPYRCVAEVVSGSVPAMKRPGFAQLVGKMEPGDVLVVTRFDRLGRSAMDVQTTIEMLAGIPVKVHCLAIPGVDLASPGGAFTMQVLNAVAQRERDLIIERTRSGIARARAQGKQFGRRRSRRKSTRRSWPRFSRGRASPPLRAGSRHSVLRSTASVTATLGRYGQ